MLGRLPLKVVEHARAIDAAMHGRRNEAGELAGDLLDDFDVDVDDLVLVERSQRKVLMNVT